MIRLCSISGYDPNMMDPSMSGPGGPQGGPPQHHQQPQQFGASNLDDLQSLMDMEGMGDW